MQDKATAPDSLAREADSQGDQCMLEQPRHPKRKVVRNYGAFESSVTDEVAEVIGFVIQVACGIRFMGLFVSRSTHTLVLDADSGRVLGDIPGQKTAHDRVNVDVLQALDSGVYDALLVDDAATNRRRNSKNPTKAPRPNSNNRIGAARLNDAEG